MIKNLSIMLFCLTAIFANIKAQEKGSATHQNFTKMKCEELIGYYGKRLKTRKLPKTLMKQLHPDDIYMLTKFGLPDSINDYTFKCPIELINSEELRIGKINGIDVILNLKDRTIYRGDKKFYLAKNITNLNFQLYVLETLWKVVIKNKKFGNYRENHNHKRYAKYFEEKLLEIDEDLLKNDTIYYWGSMIEDIEFGIVG